MSTSLEETLKTYAMSLVCHAFLLETPPIADVTDPKSRLYPFGVMVGTRLGHHDIQRNEL